MKKRIKYIMKSRNFLIALLLAVLYYSGEVYVYTVSAWSFNSIECQDDIECTRILFVADSQLIGIHNEIFHPITPFSIFDIDRYLLKTYQKAFKFAKPHVIVFLGDLFDEGSTATDREFMEYVERFWKIYGKPTTRNQQIWIPGDNDIGGEGADFVTTDKIKRFTQAFRQSDVIQVKSATFYKINRLTHTMGIINGTGANLLKRNNKNIGLSHMPILYRDSTYTKMVLSVIDPHVIFTGHEHHAAVIEKDKLLDTRRTINLIPAGNEIYEFLLSEKKLYEIMVPTASYRMGTTYIGHGFAVLENDRLHYTVLWSPSRFPILLFYGVLALSVVCYSLFTLFCMLSCGRKKTKVYSV